MQLITVSHSDDNMIATWQATNGAAWCQRLSGTISHTTCDHQRSRSMDKYGDLRCQGCGGLENQDKPQPERPVLAIVWNADHEPDELTVTDDGEISEVDQCSTLDDEEIEDLLAEMFTIDDLEYDDIKDVPEPAYIEDPPEPTRRSVPVYVGRCTRCGDGYMSNILETQFDVRDEDVYRCLACGWRTSVQYENNRALFAAGGTI